MPSLRTTTLLAAATAIAGGVIAAVALGGEDQTRQQAVADRGAKVMPFSLDATRHVFNATATGGTQRVVADDPRDHEQIRLVREHLREEATAFQRGDFADPASIHGEDMPGLADLRAGYTRFTVRYRDLPDGAQIDYRTTDPSLVTAIRDWFDAQLGDHGADAQAGGHSSADPSMHPGHKS
jgi:hypothetical protein